MLTLDPIVKVNVAVAASAVIQTSFDVGLIMTAATEAFTTTVRANTYNSLADVAEDFASSTNVYKAAEKYFGVSPAPRMLVIGAVGSGETMAAALDAIRFKNQDWYGVYYDGAATADVKAIDTWLNDQDYGMQFATVTGTIGTINTSGTLHDLNEAKSMRTCFLYSSTAMEAAAVMGVAMGCASAYTGATWQLCYKTITGIAANTSLTQADIEALNAVNVNVYVTRAYNRDMFERGMTPSTLRVDEVIALDRISSEIQVACLDLIADNAVKLPQTDATTTRFVAVITEVLEAYVSAGYIMRGVWRGARFGNIGPGDALEKGYSIWADSFDNQAETDRKARKSMPIYVGICFSGAVESVVINVSVQE